MAYDFLNRMKSEGSLSRCSMVVSEKVALRGRKTVFGKDIIRITRSFIEFRGGETGHEKLRIPINSVQEIAVRGRTVFRKKKRIEKIYPRA